MSHAKEFRPPDLSTRAVHAGETHGAFEGSLTTPIVQSSTFVFPNLDTVRDYAAQQIEYHEYSRMSNPTMQAVEQKMADLEEAEDARLFDSGMSALTCTFLTLLSQGQHLIITSDGYKRTISFARQELARWGIECTMVPPADTAAVQAAMQPNTAVIFTEAPSNPHLYLPDIPALAEIARAGQAVLIIDATLASPCGLRPLTLGADLVVHSATKYLGGHNDVLGGVVCGSAKLVEQIRTLHMTLGGVLDPHGCFLLLRGLKTLPLRMERHNATALQVAQFLEAHPKVTRVYYPGLPSHPQHELAKRMMQGYGGMVSFEIAGNWEAAARFIDRLELCLLASSLGGVESLVYHPATLLQFSMSPQEREQFGLLDSLIRLAVGIEHPDDIIADLERGLAAV